MSVILSITLYVIGYMELMLVYNSGADPGFRVGGGANTYKFARFPQKLYEFKKI